MEEFTKSISSISWWLGVVFVGILLNVISAYIKSPLDLFFSGISGWWRSRSEIQIAKRTEAIEKLRANFEEQLMLAHTENRHRQRGTLFALATVFMLVLYLSAKLSLVNASIKGLETNEIVFIRSFFYWSSMLIAFFSVIEISKANSCQSLLKDARDKISKDNQL